MEIRFHSHIILVVRNARKKVQKVGRYSAQNARQTLPSPKEPAWTRRPSMALTLSAECFRVLLGSRAYETLLVFMSI